jgi:hypothetical protein
MHEDSGCSLLVPGSSLLVAGYSFFVARCSLNAWTINQQPGTSIRVTVFFSTSNKKPATSNAFFFNEQRETSNQQWFIKNGRSLSAP